MTAKTNLGVLRADMKNIKDDILEIKDGMNKGRDMHTKILLSIQKNQDAIQNTQNNMNTHFTDHKTWSNRVWGVIILAIGSFVTSIISLARKAT